MESEASRAANLLRLVLRAHSRAPEKFPMCPADFAIARTSRPSRIQSLPITLPQIPLRSRPARKPAPLLIPAIDV